MSTELIETYTAGPARLRRAIDGMNEEQLRAHPVAGKWSTHEVVCHVADFEPVYVDRMTRVIANDEPRFFGGDPDDYAARLAYDQRVLAEELTLIEATRTHMARILRALSPEQFQRIGHHSQRGAMTLEDLLRAITNHIPHHIRFIEDKRRALGLEAM